MTPSTGEATQWLQAWSQGDRAALDRLIPVVHQESCGGWPSAVWQRNGGGDTQPSRCRPRRWATGARPSLGCCGS